jgi:hypothetical protein
LKNYKKTYQIIHQSSGSHRIFFYFLISCYLYTVIATASGGYDNGTATGKSKLGLDLTWNPFNYFPGGQSYVVLSYGFSDKFDFHSYYSHPASGSDNYYLGLFYQFYKNKYLDLATAVGVRQYRPEYQKHLFAPQLLYTLYVYKGLRLGGSVVNIRDIDRNNKLIGTTVDIALIIPLFKSDSINGRVNSVDFCIGAFRPILWEPYNLDWHPTYSFNIKLKIP